MEATRVRSKQLKYDGKEIPKSICASLAKDQVSTVQADHAVGGFAGNLVIATPRMALSGWDVPSSVAMVPAKTRLTLPEGTLTRTS